MNIPIAICSFYYYFFVWVEYVASRSKGNYNSLGLATLNLEVNSDIQHKNTALPPIECKIITFRFHGN